MSTANSPRERQADRVAKQIVEQGRLSEAIVPAQRSAAMGRAGEAHGQELQRKAPSEGAPSALDTPGSGSALLRNTAQSAEAPHTELGSGHPLPSHTRRLFESRFQHDFSHVRVHANSTAARRADAIDARAYTQRNHIVFNQGQYRPDASAGKLLLAHELTHVVQQLGTGSTDTIQRSCFDGNCDDCVGGVRDLWVTAFFARRANADTMAKLRTAINGAKAILANCCVRLKFDFNWTLIPGAASIESASMHRRPDGSPLGLFNVPEPQETIGEGDLIARARGVPMLVVDEVIGTGGGTTILGGRDDAGRNFDVEYTGPSMFFLAVNQPNPNGNCNNIAHELWHIPGGLRHDAAEGGITACTNNNVSQAYCNAVRTLA